MLRQQRLHFGEIPRWRHDDARIALYRLGDHGGDFAALLFEHLPQGSEGALCRLVIAHSPFIRPGNERHVPIRLQLRIGPPHAQARHAHRQIGAAVQALLQRDEASFSRMQTGQQQSTFIGL